MEMKKTCWEILGINTTSNIKEIKRAYARLTKYCHPEDNPKEFMDINNAFVSAMQYVKGHKLVEIAKNELIKENLAEKKLRSENYSTRLDVNKEPRIIIKNESFLDDFEIEEFPSQFQNQDEHLRNVYMLLTEDCSKKVLTAILHDPTIKKLKNSNQRFKINLLKLILSFSEIMDEQTLHYVKKTLKPDADLVNLNVIDTALLKYKKKSKWSTVVGIICCLLFIAVLVMAIIRQIDEAGKTTSSDPVIEEMLP